MLPFCLWGHCHWSCRDKSRCLESFMDNLFAQDICSHCHGYCSPSYDAKPAPLIMCSLCFCLCDFKSHWCGHWNHNRCHNSGFCGRLDLRHINGYSMWSFHLCLHKPSAIKGLYTPEAHCSWHTLLQVFGSVVRRWRNRCCHDLGHLRSCWSGCLPASWSVIFVRRLLLASLNERT